MKIKISLIGGDLRIVTLAQSLSKDGNEIAVYGMENSNEINKDKQILKCKTIDEAIEKSDIIIGSIPFLKSENEMYATFSDSHIDIKDLIKKEHKDKIFIAGSIPSNIKKIISEKYKKVIDVMEIEELLILNTIATAEGAIEVAINNLDTIIHGSKVLVLGFGRVAKVVAKEFYGIGANVTCAARKNTDLAWANAFGYDSIHIGKLKENLKDYDIIINTVPQIIIDKEKMKYMNSKVLLIDLASNPGGINREDAKKLNLKLVWALALPGKVAPVTSAEFIKQAIYNTLK